MKTKPSRLIQLLSALSNDEIKRLNRFVQATYFNTDQYVTKLLDVLNKDIIGKRTFDELVQWRVYGKVFNKSPQSQEKLNEKEKKLLGAKMSALTQLTKDFLTIEALKGHKTYRNDLLLSELLNRSQFDLFQSIMKKERKVLETEQERGIKYHQHEYMIEKRVFDYLFKRNLLIKDDNLIELNKSIDTLYLLDKLKFYLAGIHIKSAMSREDYELPSIAASEDLLNLVQYQHHPLVQIYRTAIAMTETQEHENYEMLLKLLKQNAQHIPKDGVVDFYTMAINFCAAQIRGGKLEYHRHVFDLFRKMEKNDLFKEDNILLINRLKNAVGVSCNAKEFEWGKFVIEKYRPYIAKEVRDSVCYFNLGAIAFHEKNYKEAIQNFIRVERINLNYDLNCRMLILKSHYETDEEYDERTVQIFRSTEKFVSDNKQLSSTHKKADKNFINILINLYRVKHRAGKMTLQSIRQKIEKFELINDKRWLLEKIDELEK